MFRSPFSPPVQTLITAVLLLTFLLPSNPASQTYAASQRGNVASDSTIIQQRYSNFYKTSLASQVNQGITVSITDQGFEPTHLTIAQGERVTWLNKTQTIREIEIQTTRYSIFLPSIKNAGMVNASFIPTSLGLTHK
jgi:plastocyanin